MPDYTNSLESLKKSIADLNTETTREIVKKALESEIPAEIILNEGISAALEEVGKKFESGEYFLSELVMAGEVVREVLDEEILPAIREKIGEKSAYKGTIIIGSVEGDLHDIGKNIVSTFLSASGLKVIDLGVDVSPEKFVEEVKRNNAKVVGLSCLLTTTIPSIRKTTIALEKAGLRPSVKVIVGGRPVNEIVTKEGGADDFAKNAPEGSKKVLILLKQN